MILKGGTLYYDTPIGVLCLASDFAKPPGHIRNPRSYDFPVVCRVVEGADIPGILFNPTPELLAPFIEAAQQLEKDGVQAISGSCGFLARFQAEVAAAVSIPVFLSSLLQLPMLKLIHGPNARIGVLTASSEALKEEHFQACNCTRDEVSILGMEGTTEFWQAIIQGQRNDLDMTLLEQEICDKAAELAADGLDALLLECTDLPPFAAAIQERVGLPVYDINSLMELMAYSVCRKPYNRF